MKEITLKKQNTINSYRALINGDAYPPLAPLELFLEVSNVCNLRCAMCPTFSAISRHRSNSLGEQQRGFINLEHCLGSLETILPHALYVHAFGYGEPTIHPHFQELISYLSKFRVMIDFITNGTKLTAELCDFLVKNKVAKVTISFSGSNKADYENIYIGSKFEQVLTGMKNLQQAKKLSGSRYPALTVNSIAFRHHINNLPDFVDLMAAHGVEKIEVKKLLENVDHLRGHAAPFTSAAQAHLDAAKIRAHAHGLDLDADQYERESAPGANNLPTTKIDKFKEIAHEISSATKGTERKDIAPLDLFTLPPNDLDLELSLQPLASKFLGGAEPFYCLEPFKTFYVRQSGKVKPCCFSADKAAALGNIHHHPAQEIWQGAPFTKIRQGIALGRYPLRHCQFCLREGAGPKNNDIPAGLKNFQQWYETCFQETLERQPRKGLLRKLLPSAFPPEPSCEIPTQSIIANLKAKHPNHFIADQSPPPLTLAKLTEAINRRWQGGREVDDLVSGKIERLNRREARGWFMLPHLPDFHPTLVVYHQSNGQEIARGRADQTRNDLPVSDNRSNSHAFQIPLDPEWDQGESLTADGLKILVVELGLTLADLLQTHECAVPAKLWRNINQLLELENTAGFWQDQGNDWAWLANEAEFSLTAPQAGELSFHLIVPEDPMVQQILPFTIRVLTDGTETEKIIFTKADYRQIRQRVAAKQTIRYRLSCDQFITPNEYYGNADTRKLSVIVGHFGLL